MKNHPLAIILGLILGCGTISAQPSTETNKLSPAELEEWVSHLSCDEMRGRRNGSPEMEEAALWIEGKFREFGIRPVFEDGELIQPFNFTTRGGTEISERNVVGIIRGSDPALRDEYIIISAHFDHIGVGSAEGDSIFNGADDNAAGTVTLLSVAKWLKENNTCPGRSILFAAVSGEEMGMRGSRHLAANLPLPAEKAYVNINFEMTGHSDDLGKGKYYMTGCSYSNLDELVAEFQTEEMHELIDTIPMAERLFFASDNIAFSRMEVEDEVVRGIPSGTFVTTITSDHIHRPKDEIDLFDFENMASLVSYFGELIHWLSYSDEEIKWTKANYQRPGQWKGQAPVKEVSTETVPVQLQYIGDFDLGDGMHISNDFEGSRMNGAARVNDSLISVLISPENEPINMSPWYAFKLWSETPRDIYVKLNYPDPAAHRYHPKVSRDAKSWTALEEDLVEASIKEEGDSKVVKDITMKLSVGPEPLWVSAQELLTIAHMDDWVGGLEKLSFVKKEVIGNSREGRPILMLRLGKKKNEKMILVLSRQHPPEIPGYLGMEAFVETLCADTELAKDFRKEYTIYVVPMVNPDGVANGHWRHNRGGIDLNRDWKNFNQPETAAIRDLLEQLTATEGSKIYFGIDFHSTQQDIYYTIDPELEGNMPGLVPELIERTGKEFPDYTPNVKPRNADAPVITSTAFLFFEYGAEAITYEVGDETPRDFIKKKAEVTAEKLMELMTE